jgi:hypothetical protein
MIIRMKHVRAAGMCNREPRIFCARQGWSWQEFLDHGFPEEQLLATDDPMALRVVEAAHKLEDGE